MTWQEELTQLFETRIGIWLQVSEPFGSLERCVKARMRALGLRSPHDYLAQIKRQSPDSVELNKLTTLLTNGHTTFFRDRQQWQVIRELLRALRTKERRQTIRIWSAGCSTGQEPHSLAILCHSIGLKVAILATDVNTAALNVARKGEYDTWSADRTPEAFRHRYFERSGDRCKVSDDARRLISFRRHNLALDPAPLPNDKDGVPWDFVMCQNVLIYFRPAVTQVVLRKMATVLSPTGFLLLGAAESIRHLDVPLLPVPFSDRVVLQHASAFPVGTREGPVPMPTSDEHDGDAIANQSPEDIDGDESTSFGDVVELLNTGNVAGAQQQLVDLLNSETEHLLARITLGNLCLRRHSFDDASAHYALAHAVDPLLPELHFFLGLLHRKLGNHELAENSFRRALFLEPDFWPASFLLAGVYARLGKRGRRLQELKNTETALQNGCQPPSFQSHPCGLPEADLSAQEVMATCRKVLARRGL